MTREAAAMLGELQITEIERDLAEFALERRQGHIEAFRVYQSEQRIDTLERRVHYLKQELKAAGFSLPKDEARVRPDITGTKHPLPFDRLSPLDFERLCLWLAHRQGFGDLEHWGALGSDFGCDVLASRDGKKWAFQCKRVKSFGYSAALKEIAKILDWQDEERPSVLVFVVACDVAAETRRKAKKHCKKEGIKCKFWARNELDLFVNEHPDIVHEFFQVG